MIITLPNGVVLDLVIEVTNSWSTGFVTKVTLTNTSSVPLENWSLDLDLAPGLAVANSNQMVESQTGTTATFVPDQPWLTTISPNETATFTFRSDGQVADPATDIVPVAFNVDGTDFPIDDAAGSVDTNLIVKNTWPTGAWLQVTITNNTDDAIVDWTLPIELPAGLTFASSGAVNFVDNGDGTFSLDPKKDFLNFIAAGDTIVIGFNVAGDPALVNQITKGELVGFTPPTATNDTSLPFTYDTATGILTLHKDDILANDFSSDGSPVDIAGAFTVAGGGTSKLLGDIIEYDVQPTETGRIAIGYEIIDGNGRKDTAQILIDLPTAPELTVDDVTVNEADGTATFTVTLAGALALLDTVEVDYATRDREALAGIDFAATSGTLTFDDATRTQTVTVNLIDDNVEELTETFDLLLSNAKGARIVGDAGEATILDDATDVGPLGDNTAGFDVQVDLAGQFVVGHSFTLTVTNNTGAVATGSPLVTIAMQDGMKLAVQGGGNYSPVSGSSVAQDGQSSVVGWHDDIYYTMALNPTYVDSNGNGIVDAGDRNPDLADGTWDDGDVGQVELFFRGSHFFVDLDDRIEVAPTLVAEQPGRPFTPLDMTYKGFNTAFFNRSEVTQSDIDASFQEQQDLGANSIAIVTTHFMDDKDSTEVKANDFTMTDADLRTAIQTAHSDGLDVLLKPHIDLESGQFRGRLLNTAGDKKISEFFFGYEGGYDPTRGYEEGSYGELIMRYAQIAEEEGVDSMLIGTELVDLAKSRNNLDEWNQLISDVDTIYSGKLSYATIVGEELFVRFWDNPAIDFISLDIYPPLTDTNAPSVGELVDGWTELPTTDRGLEAYFNLPITDLIAGLSEQYGKKIVITETGFRSVDGIASRPFDFNLQGAADLQEQMDAYDSFFTAAVEEMGEYLDGVFLWEYPNQPSLEDGTILQPDNYTPQNKPVLELIEDFFDIA